MCGCLSVQSDRGCTLCVAVVYSRLEIGSASQISPNPENQINPKIRKHVAAFGA